MARETATSASTRPAEKARGRTNARRHQTGSEARQVLGVRTKSVDDGTVVLEWDANVDHYEVFVGEGEIPDDYKGDPVHGTTATITGLPNGRPALFRVRAVSRVGTTGLFRGEWSAPHAATPRAPIKPAKITTISSDPREGEIVWTWDAPDGGGKLIIGYELEWKKVGEDAWNLVQGLAEASYTLATDGHESTYVVRGQSSGGGGSRRLVGRLGRGVLACRPRSGAAVACDHDVRDVHLAVV